MSETDATKVEPDETSATADSGEPIQLPSDHPLVRTLEKLRAETKSLRESGKAGEEAAKRLKELEDKDKTEIQKLAEEKAAAESAAKSSTGELMRLRVAMRKGLTEAQAKRLVGATEEEMEADADDLLVSFGGDKKQADTDGKPTRPKERLRSGAAPDEEPDETDPRKLAASVPRL